MAHGVMHVYLIPTTASATQSTATDLQNLIGKAKARGEERGKIPRDNKYDYTFSALHIDIGNLSRSAVRFHMGGSRSIRTGNNTNGMMG